ncbi:protein of unknown function [Nitrospira japonica]|uniref:Uncharacterized protein n=1 Tax=Nitrospira japonica TaxID=1325564 RepID=A0A1W1I0Q9_9BACT|nr:protein of unknown function [Nitrospira japonica]
MTEGEYNAYTVSGIFLPSSCSSVLAQKTMETLIVNIIYHGDGGLTHFNSGGLTWSM